MASKRTHHSTKSEACQDAGALEQARLLEALGLLHITLQGTLGTGFSSAVKIVS